MNDIVTDLKKAGVPTRVLTSMTKEGISAWSDMISWERVVRSIEWNFLVLPNVGKASLPALQKAIVAYVKDHMLPRHPTLAECYMAGAGKGTTDSKDGGLPDTEEERGGFSEYMRGHCWARGQYDYSRGCYQDVQTRMLYGIWRDRGALPTVNNWRMP